MSDQQIAREFIQTFCTGDIEALEPLLDPALIFHCPLASFDSRQAYLDRLNADPPVPGEHKILSLTEKGDDVVVRYEYRKPLVTLTITQWFGFCDGRIRETRLDFDMATGMGGAK